MRAQKSAARWPSAQYMKVNAASHRATLAVMPKKAAVRREGRRRRRLAPNTSIKTLVTAVGTAYSENEYRAASIIDTFNLPAELREGLIVTQTRVTPSVSEGPGGVGGATRQPLCAARPPRPLAHARGDMRLCQTAEMPQVVIVG